MNVWTHRSWLLTIWPKHKTPFPSPSPRWPGFKPRTLQLVYDPEWHSFSPLSHASATTKQSTENEHQNNPQKTQAKYKPSIKNASPKTPDEKAAGGDRDMVEGSRQGGTYSLKLQNAPLLPPSLSLSPGLLQGTRGWGSCLTLTH